MALWPTATAVSDASHEENTVGIVEWSTSMAVNAPMVESTIWAIATISFFDAHHAFSTLATVSSKSSNHAPRFCHMGMPSAAPTTPSVATPAVAAERMVAAPRSSQ